MQALRMGELTVICAWCRKLLMIGQMGVKPVSHGICEECAEKFTREAI